MSDALPPDREPELVEEPHRRLEVLKDNLEAFTIALVLALVIKHFCVEAFKIPTGSMMPTLYGERGSPQGVGDRILVDKLAYLAQGPQRGDVVVFRYPLNQAKHFIKRVGGVGPEWLKIVRGDLWVRASQEDPWGMATKRRRVRDELYLPVYPPAPTAIRALQASEPKDYWDAGPGWAIGDYDALAFAGGAPSAARLLRAIGQDSLNTYGGLRADGGLVRDVRLLLEAKAEEGSTVALRWCPADDELVEVRLVPPGSGGGSQLLVRRPGLEVVEPLGVALATGRWTAVELECLDGEVYAHVDGEERAHVDLKVHIEDVRELEDFTQRAEIEAGGGAVAVRGFRAERDIHYTDGGMRELGRSGSGVWIPEGHYFMLGDNTTGSSDSRKWELIAIDLVDGREILYEAHDDENRPTWEEGGFKRVTDHEGIERRWNPKDQASSPRTVPHPLVPRSLVVGRAFFVFWPLTPHFPGRAGFIH